MEEGKKEKIKMVHEQGCMKQGNSPAWEAMPDFDPTGL